MREIILFTLLFVGAGLFVLFGDPASLFQPSSGTLSGPIAKQAPADEPTTETAPPATDSGNVGPLKIYTDVGTETNPAKGASQKGSTAGVKVVSNYDLRLSVAQVGDTLEISGTISGPECRKVRVTYFVRSDTGRYGDGSTVVENVSLGEKTIFSTTKSLEERKQSKTSTWQVTSSTAVCHTL